MLWTGYGLGSEYYWAEFKITNDTPDEMPKEPETSKISTDMSIRLKEGTLTQNGATFVITDKVERETRNIDNTYTIARKNGDKWEEIEVKKRPETVEIQYIKEQVIEKQINWSEKYGELEVGTYRLVMQENGSKYYWTDFDITAETPKGEIIQQEEPQYTGNVIEPVNHTAMSDTLVLN